MKVYNRKCMKSSNSKHNDPFNISMLLLDSNTTKSRWIETFTYSLLIVRCFSSRAAIFVYLIAPSVRIKYLFIDTKAKMCFFELVLYRILFSIIISITTMTIINIIPFEWTLLQKYLDMCVYISWNNHDSNKSYISHIIHFIYLYI